MTDPPFLTRNSLDSSLGSALCPFTSIKINSLSIEIDPETLSYGSKNFGKIEDQSSYLIVVLVGKDVI